uniref:Uncharacterized protein n=1 Tax=Nesodiprion zhejiangensis nucleopolyhedrovirus TaxID=3135970 RepID=A0AAN0N7E6_9BACU
MYFVHMLTGSLLLVLRDYIHIEYIDENTTNWTKWNDLRTDRIGSNWLI